MNYSNSVLIIGCGVSGLSCGIRLLEAGFGTVRIMARELPPHTTSDRAAAIWYPYKAYPEDKVLAWGAATFRAMTRLMADPASGISNTILLEPFVEPTADPWWKEAVTAFRHALPEEVPVGYGDGYVVEVPLIETPLYMVYLLDWFQRLGGVIEQGEVQVLADLAAKGRLIINCAGLGAKALTNDEGLYPIRGQIVRVTAVADKTSFVDEFSARGLAYVVPRRNDTIIGGTAQVGDWNLTADPQTAEEILLKCRQLQPALAGVEILEHAVGLRPGRDRIRLECEALGEDCVVIHNYGHGGAGFTLSWGCADEVTALAISWSQEGQAR
jgi:D-amino-acid oxidase